MLLGFLGVDRFCLGLTGKHVDDMTCNLYWQKNIVYVVHIFACRFVNAKDCLLIFKGVCFPLWVQEKVKFLYIRPFSFKNFVWEKVISSKIPKCGIWLSKSKIPTECTLFANSFNLFWRHCSRQTYDAWRCRDLVDCGHCVAGLWTAYAWRWE